MAVFHRALFIWFQWLVFLILLAVRLDEKTTWNWFIVFTPMWLFDSNLLIYMIIRTITHCKYGHENWWRGLHKKCWYLFSVLLKMAFQIALCIKLEYEKELSTFYVVIPLWALLFGLTIDVVTNLFGLQGH